MSAPKPRNCYSNTDDGGKPPTRLEATGQARPTRANLAAPNQVTAPTSNATVAHAEPTLTPKPPKTPPKRREETRAYHHPRKWSNSSQRPAGERNKPHQQARCPMTRRDYLAGVATYGGALVLLIGLIGGWTWPLALGGLTLITGLLTLNQGDQK